MADPGAEARIRELKRRMTQDPTSPLFMALAEEYRAAGHLPEAVRILEKGVNTHAGYVSARVALARAYLEVGRTEESITMFSRALASDPGNLVAARSLAEIHLSRGDRIEGIKKYKLYRALSGDRGVDEIIAKIGAELTLVEAPREAPQAQGRVLADLYMEQGHPREALAIYEELSQADPSNAELEQLRQAAAAGGSGQEPLPQALQPEPDLARRQARVERLKRWLAVIQAG